MAEIAKTVGATSDAPGDQVHPQVGAIRGRPIGEAHAAGVRMAVIVGAAIQHLPGQAARPGSLAGAYLRDAIQLVPPGLADLRRPAR